MLIRISLEGLKSSKFDYNHVYINWSINQKKHTVGPLCTNTNVLGKYISTSKLVTIHKAHL
jgi:hypothetical protein